MKADRQDIFSKHVCILLTIIRPNFIYFKQSWYKCVNLYKHNITHKFKQQQKIIVGKCK